MTKPNRAELLIMLTDLIGVDESKAKVIEKFVNKHDVFGVKALKKKYSNLEKCPNCRGKKMINIDRHGNYQDCKHCKGTGFIGSRYEEGKWWNKG